MELKRAHSKPAIAIFATFFIALTIGIILSLRILLWPILAGFLIAFVLDPIVDYFESKNLNRTFIISLIFLGFVLLGVLAVILFAKPIVVQIQRMIEDAPAYGQLLDSNLKSQVGKLAARWPDVDWEGYLAKGRYAVKNYYENLPNTIPSVFTNVFGIAASAVIVPFVTFFLLRDGAGIKKQFIGLIPNRYFEMALTLFFKVHRQISLYLRGVILDNSIVALIYAIGYSILQIKYAIFLGIFAGVANFIPYLGPWLAGGAAMIAIFFDPSAAYPWWSVLVVVGIAQFTENNIIYPVVMGRSVNIHPLVILLGLFVGGEVGGLLGMVVAVPVIAVVKVVTEVLYDGLKRFSMI